tara:strand:- start:227 stop:595 length:369 start_codon:yes stop_codon:yes gene_type:complete
MSESYGTAQIISIAVAALLAVVLLAIFLYCVTRGRLLRTCSQFWCCLTCRCCGSCPAEPAPTPDTAAAAAPTTTPGSVVVHLVSNGMHPLQERAPERAPLVRPPRDTPPCPPRSNHHRVSRV